MGNYDDENLLQMIELYAEEKGYISCEYDLSERFDNEIMPMLIETYGIKGEAFDDDPMVNESFSNWSDSLCKGGEIHPEQYNQYCYVGKYSQ